MVFLFKCSCCSTYTVDQQTFRSFITPELNQALDDRIGTQPLEHVTIDFGSYCPRCKPDSEYHVDLKVTPVGDEC